MTWSKTKAESRIPLKDTVARPRHPGWMSLALVFFILFPSFVSAAPLAYLESFPQPSDPSTLIHLIDGNDATEWCTAAGTERTRIRFHFNEPQAIAHVRVSLGEALPSPLNLKFSSEKLVLAVAMQAQKLRVELTKPLEGSYVDVLIPESHKPVCLSAIELSSTRRNLTQVRENPEVLKARLALAGTWKSGPLGAPNTASWTFSLDGTWFWHHNEPLLARSASLRGMWSLSAGQLILTVPSRKSPITLSLARQAIQIDEWAEDAPDADYEELNISAASKLGLPLPGRYNNARFEMLE